MAHAAILPTRILLNKSSKYKRLRTFLKCLISGFILPRRHWFGGIISALDRCDAWLLLGIKVADPEGEVTQFSDMVVVSITGWVDKDVLSDLPS